MNAGVRWPAWLAYAAAVFALYWFALRSLDLIILAVWFSVAALLAWSGRTRVLRAAEARLHTLAVALFPLWEFVLKWLIAQDYGSARAFWLNRAEHWLWMTATVILFYPLFWRAWRVLYPLSRLVLFTGLASLIGNLIEFYEYGVRLAVAEPPFERAYRDTLIDMGMNLLGGLSAYLLVGLASGVRGPAPGEEAAR